MMESLKNTCVLVANLVDSLSLREMYSGEYPENSAACLLLAKALQELSLIHI